MSDASARGADRGEGRGAAQGPPEAETVLLFGATGLVGGELLELLLSEGVRVVSYGRRPSGVSHPRLEERVGDPAGWETSDAPPAGAALCALGTTLRSAGSREAFRAVDHDLVLSAARLAKRAGAPHFVLVSSLGADPRSRVFYNRVKGEAEEGLRAVGFEAVTVLRPSLLLGSREERRPAERAGQLLGRLAAPLMRGPLRRCRPVEAGVVARAMVRAVRDATPGWRVMESEEIAEMGRG